MSTISSAYFEKELSKSIQIKPLSDILRIEAASGHDIPYKGYVELDVCVPYLSKVNFASIITCGFRDKLQ